MWVLIQKGCSGPETLHVSRAPTGAGAAGLPLAGRSETLAIWEVSPNVKHHFCSRLSAPRWTADITRDVESTSEGLVWKLFTLELKKKKNTENDAYFDLKKKKWRK